MEKMNENEMRTAILKYDETLMECSGDIDKALMALNELINNYDSVLLPDARKAIEHGTTIGGSKDEQAQFSWKYIYDYKRIMWLIRIAFDYCSSVSQSINSFAIEN